LLSNHIFLLFAKEKYFITNNNKNQEKFVGLQMNVVVI